MLLCLGENCPVTRVEEPGCWLGSLFRRSWSVNWIASARCRRLKERGTACEQSPLTPQLASLSGHFQKYSVQRSRIKLRILGSEFIPINLLSFPWREMPFTVLFSIRLRNYSCLRFSRTEKRPFKGINNAAHLGNIKPKADLGRWTAGPAPRKGEGAVLYFASRSFYWTLHFRN